MTTNYNETETSLKPRSRWIVAGQVLSGLAILALAIDAGGKLFVPEAMIANSPPLGLPADPNFHRMLGVILAFCVVLYAVPRTTGLGAIMLTGYLGGAVATHLRIDSPLFTHTLFGIYIGTIVWAGLLLRKPQFAALLGLAQRQPASSDL